MSDETKLPPDLAAYIEPYYVDVFGTFPPIPKERLETGAVLAPELNLACEEARKQALFSDVFDNKTAQLFVAVIMVGDFSPGLNWHLRAARQYSATWEELYKAVEIAAFFKGFSALQEGGVAVGRMWKEEQAQAQARDPAGAD